MIPLPIDTLEQEPTWGQIKGYPPIRGDLEKYEGKAVTPNNLAVAMFAHIYTAVSIPPSNS